MKGEEESNTWTGGVIVLGGRETGRGLKEKTGVLERRRKAKSRGMDRAWLYGEARERVTSARQKLM